MIREFPKYVDFLVKTKITADDYTLLYMIYLGNERLIEKYLSVAKGPSSTGENNSYGFETYRIQYLIEMGYLKSLAKEEKMMNYPVLFEVTPKFTELLLMEGRVAGRQLFNRYPKWMNVNGKNFSTSGGGADLEEVFELYVKKIGNSVEKHQFVLEMVDKGIRNGLINTNLRNFVMGEVWENISEYLPPQENVRNI